MTPKIFIAMPTTGNMRTELYNILTYWSTSGKYDLTLFVEGKIHPIARSRNVIVSAFLDSDCEYLFWIDSDMSCPIDTLDKLLEHNKEMVSAVAFMWQYVPEMGCCTVMPMATIDNRPVFGNSLMEVNRSNVNCTLIKREVLETLGVGSFRYEYENDRRTTLIGGEDYMFCDEVKAAGYSIYVDFGLVSSHYKTVDLKDIGALLQRTTKSPGKQKTELHSAVVDSVLDNKHWNTALDVGAGWGGFLPLIRSHTDKVIGLDIIKNSDLYDEFIEMEFNPLDVNTDVVFMFDVIEHVTHEEGERWLNNIKVPILLTTPSKMSDNKSQVKLNNNKYQEHLSLWTREELESLGFKTVLCTNSVFESEYGKQIIAFRNNYVTFR